MHCNFTRIVAVLCAAVTAGGICRGADEPTKVTINDLADLLRAKQDALSTLDIEYTYESLPTDDFRDFLNYNARDLSARYPGKFPDYRDKSTDMSFYIHSCSCHLLQHGNKYLMESVDMGPKKNGTEVFAFDGLMNIYYCQNKKEGFISEKSLCEIPFYSDWVAFVPDGWMSKHGERTPLWKFLLDAQKLGSAKISDAGDRGLTVEALMPRPTQPGIWTGMRISFGPPKTRAVTKIIVFCAQSNDPAFDPVNCTPVVTYSDFIEDPAGGLFPKQIQFDEYFQFGPEDADRLGGPDLRKRVFHITSAKLSVTKVTWNPVFQKDSLTPNIPAGTEISDEHGGIFYKPGKDAPKPPARNEGGSQ